MSALLVLVFASGLGLADAQDPAGRGQPPAEAPAPSQIGDEPGVLTGHGPVRHTPVPGVRFRTAAPGGGQTEGPAERRLGGDPPIPFPTLGGSTGGTTLPPGTPGGSGGTIPITKGDDAGVAGGARPTRPPR